MLTRGLSAGLAGSGIQVNALAPGCIRAELTQALVNNQEFSASVRGRTSAARWGEPEDVLSALLFICSSAADFVNGQVLYVDGGMTAVV